MDWIEPYTKSRQIFACPSQPKWFTNAACPTSSVNYGYIYNPRVLTTYNATGSPSRLAADCSWPGTQPKARHLNELDKPAETFMVTERGRYDRAYYGELGGTATDATASAFGASGAANDPYLSSGTSTNAGRPNYRHLETGNFLYVDGHVKALKPDVTLLKSIEGPTPNFN